MATSELWQRNPTPISSPESAEGAAKGSDAYVWVRGALWMVLDVITIFGSAVLVVIYEIYTETTFASAGIWNHINALFPPTGTLIVLLCGFSLTLLFAGLMLKLYAPAWTTGILHEQRLSLLACSMSALLLMVALFAFHAEDSFREIMLATIGLVTVALGLHRMIYRLLIYPRFNRSFNTRNVLVLGTGAGAHILRQRLGDVSQLGYTFKGLIEVPGSGSDETNSSGKALGTLDKLFHRARRQLVDEIFFTTPIDHDIERKLLEQAGRHGIYLRMIPVNCDGQAWNNPVERFGQLLSILLKRNNLTVFNLVLKRALDLAFSTSALLILPPFLLVIAIAIKFDSRGPIFYFSDRVGRQGRVFRLIKFRTMVRDAEERQADLLNRNERDGVLFKITDDPRTTKVGRFLRKYSLDELPQFFNVLRGDMSVVGPRPPLVSEVWGYELSHLRRLEVTPGITGLWQVQARQDPSFDSYISLDCSYIENWSIWLDLKIIARTVGVVVAGTGS